MTLSFLYHPPLTTEVNLSGIRYTWKDGPGIGAALVFSARF